MPATTDFNFRFVREIIYVMNEFCKLSFTNMALIGIPNRYLFIDLCIIITS